MIVRGERGIVVDWLIRVIIGLAVVGVVLFDAGSIMVNRFGLDSAANDVAVAVSTTVAGSAGHGVNLSDHEVFLEVKEVVQSEENGVSGARVVRKGTHIDDQGVIHVKLRRTADTLIVNRIDAISHWARATATGRAGTT